MIEHAKQVPHKQTFQISILPFAGDVGMCDEGSEGILQQHIDIIPISAGWTRCIRASKLFSARGCFHSTKIVHADEVCSCQPFHRRTDTGDTIAPETVACSKGRPSSSSRRSSAENRCHAFEPYSTIWL